MGEIAALAPCILGPGVGGPHRFSALWLSRIASSPSTTTATRLGCVWWRKFSQEHIPREGKFVFKVEICILSDGRNLTLGNRGYYDKP